MLMHAATRQLIGKRFERLLVISKVADAVVERETPVAHRAIQTEGWPPRPHTNLMACSIRWHMSNRNDKACSTN